MNPQNQSSPCKPFEPVTVTDTFGQEVSVILAEEHHPGHVQATACVRLVAWVLGFGGGLNQGVHYYSLITVTCLSTKTPLLVSAQEGAVSREA